MSKLSDDEKEAIIKRDLPGYKFIRDAGVSKSIVADSSRVEPEAGTPDIVALRKKYFGEDVDYPESTGGLSKEVRFSGDPETTNDDDEIVTVQPENKRDAWDRGSQPKSVVISGAKKKIIGSQG
jgi:hypothetical protein